MIQFNLLPDVKLEYIKARRTKRMIVSIAFMIAGGSLALLIILIAGVSLQKQHIGNLTDDIKRDSQKLEGIEDIDRILTVQNQLNKLTELHEAKPVASRLKNYILAVKPASVTYESIGISLDFVNGTMTLDGETDSIKTINQFVDTLKFTKYKTLDGETENNEMPAFTEVVLNSFSKDDDGASYSISLKFDPAIFSSTTNVELIVPQIVTTRSATERPADEIPAISNDARGGN